MFRIVDCQQGSDEWFQERLGIFTASTFNKILTSKTMVPSKTSEELINRCVAEMMIGSYEDEGYQSDAMLRGQALEYEALEFFNQIYGYEFERVGFLRAQKEVDGKKKDLMWGCSPDGLWLDKGIGLELKVPLAHTHVKYVIGKTIPDEYFHQCQGGMMVTGFNQWMFGSYHPKMRCMSVIVERDEKYIGALRSEISHCAELVEKRIRTMRMEDTDELN